MENKKKICIGLPHTGSFTWGTVMSFLGLQVPKGYQITYHMVGSCLVYDARQQIVDFAKDNDCEFVAMFDSDMVVPKDFLLKTVGLLEEKPEVGGVTGTIFKRVPPFQPCFYTKVEYDIKTQKPYLESPIEFPDKGLLPLQGMGLACCLLRTSIFDTITEKTSIKTPFYPLPNMGEDLTFSILAKKTGIPLVCDMSIDVGHVAEMPIHKAHYRTCYEEHKAKNDGSPLFGEGVITE
jgi:hypothetical protein